MGFEQNYERSLRDPLWGKALRQFAAVSKDCSNESMAKRLTEAFCMAWRKGQYLLAADVVQVFETVYRQLRDASQLQLYIRGSSEDELLHHFDSAVKPILSMTESNANTVIIADLAYKHLRRACESGVLLDVDPAQASSNLCRAFILQQVRAHLDPALRVCVQRRNESVESVHRRRDSVVSLVDQGADRLVKQMKTGSRRIVAPRTQRPAPKQLMEMSLIH